MATFTPIRPPKPIEIDKFLGINESVGDTEIKLGEAIRQENFRITKNYKLDKLNGYNLFINSENPIYGGWYGELNDELVLIFSTGGNLFKRDMSVESAETDLAALLQGAWDDSTIWDDSAIWDESANPPVQLIGAIQDGYLEIFYFGSKLWLKAGTDYKTYDGTTYADVVPKVPILSIGSPPAGGGTLFEEVNILTGKKAVRFTGDNTSTKYVLPEQNLDADLVECTINDVVKTEGVDFNVNRVLGEVTFNVAPVTDAVVYLEWTKDTGTRATFDGFKYAIDFGVDNDTNIFWFGNSSLKNVFIYSMVGDPSYYAANDNVIVGSNEFAITDLKAQQQTLLIYKENSAKVVIPRQNPNFGIGTGQSTGYNPYQYPYYDVNEFNGNIAPKMVQLIKDTPISLDGYSMYAWTITSVENQRGVKLLSERIKLSLQELDLSTAVTFDFKKEQEYWLNVGSDVYVWNYGNDTFYKFTNIQSSKFIDVEGEVYFISGNSIQRFGDYRNNNDVAIEARCYLGFTDFGQLQYRKMMRDEWIAIAPDTRTSLTVKFVTDRVEEVASDDNKIEYRFCDFNDIDFNDYSFLTNVNPQPKRLKAKVKKFTYLQVILENLELNETCTVLKLLLNAQAQGYSKGR